MGPTSYPDRVCKACHKPQSADLSLKYCAQCKSAWYCSRECQKEDWKEHKGPCKQIARPANADATTEGNPPLNDKIEKPFHKLHDRKWLHGRCEKDVYKLLIDAYRMRLEDDFYFAGKMYEDTVIYGRAHDGGQRGLERFLQNVESNNGLLPEWWNQENVDECVLFGLTDKNWGLSFRVEDSDVMKKYGDMFMPMQLRMFAEEVYGSGPAGMSAAFMMQLHMTIEIYGDEITRVCDFSRLDRDAF